jgi:hypothetical protein
MALVTQDEVRAGDRFSDCFGRRRVGHAKDLDVVPVPEQATHHLG